MYLRQQNAVYAEELAAFLGRRLIGENVLIYEPRSISAIQNNALLFIDNVWCKNFNYGRLDGFEDILVLTNEDIRKKAECAFIITDQPRLDFVNILHRFFVKQSAAAIHSSADIDPLAVLGKNIIVGPNAYIGPEVSIGDNTTIEANVVISGKVSIGKNCVIKANSTIGSEGFSFIFDRQKLQHFPQIGGIVIGENVWIGSNSTVERAALDDTIIENDVKIDDLVQIGHNTRIGRSSQITAGAIICGRASIGERCWIAPNACIDNGVIVGNDSVIGMGSAVLKDVPAESVSAGVPAKFLRSNVKS